MPAVPPDSARPGPAPAAPVVSVVIPCYNHGHFLGESVTSALGQTIAGVEVIVVDDGSTDDTAAVAAGFGDSIVYLRQENHGLSMARNAGIEAARAELVQLLDADDSLEPSALEHLVQAAERHPDTSAFVASWEEMDRDGRPLVAVTADPLPEDTFHAYLDPIVVGPPCRYLLRRGPLTAVGAFDSSLSACEDWDLWLRLAAAGHRFVAVPEAIARYRNHPGSMSKDFVRMWSNGTAVLGRAASVHRRCARCRTGVRQGRAAWRRWCYHSMLAPELRRLCRQHRYRVAASTSLRALWSDPAIAGYLAGSVHAVVPRRARGDRR